MSDPANTVPEGIARVTEAPACGMVTIRIKAGDADSADRLERSLDLRLPPRRGLTQSGDLCLLWMSPDEYLLVLPRAEVAEMVARLVQALIGHHHLVADVSDARAMFHVDGVRADEVLMKLAPVDLGALPMAEVRRTRLAQIAVALWRHEGGLTLVTFRSVAGYAADILRVSAGCPLRAPGADPADRT